MSMARRPAMAQVGTGCVEGILFWRRLPVHAIAKSTVRRPYPPSCAPGGTAVGRLARRRKVDRALPLGGPRTDGSSSSRPSGPRASTCASTPGRGHCPCPPPNVLASSCPARQGKRSLLFLLQKINKDYTLEGIQIGGPFGKYSCFDCRCGTGQHATCTSQRSQSKIGPRVNVLRKI